MALEQQMERSEELLETNEQNKERVEQARDQVRRADNRVSTAQAQTQYAYNQLQQAIADRNAAQQRANQEENGSVPASYDAAVSSAQAELRAAQRELEESRRERIEADRELHNAEGALAESSRELRNVAAELQQVSEKYGVNLSRTSQLMNLPYSQLASPLMQQLGIGKDRVDDLRQRIAASLGITAAATAGGYGGGGGGYNGGGRRAGGVSGSYGSYGGSFGSGGGSEEPIGRGIGSVFQNIFRRNTTSSNGERNYSKYRSVEDLPQHVWNAARDYQENHNEKYNSIMRQNRTSGDIKRLQNVIRNHGIAEDSVFYRRASLKDLGADMANRPLSELPGMRYQFGGIMSAAKNTKMASGDVIFEIHAPAGTPALDLTDVDSFQEVMFDSPLCYIEKVEPEGYNTTRITIKVFSSNEYHDIVDELKTNCVDYNPIQRFGQNRTSEEITSRISGGDMTEGSCSSLALAYAGNQAGYDVLDFRDGASREYFSSRASVEKIAKLPGVVSKIEYGKDDVACVEKMLQDVTPGKNYYLATGGHAAVVRQKDDRFEFLELQHPGRANGWHTLDEYALTKRFGCSRNRVSANSNFLMDTESLANSQEFLGILGYINTSNNAQRKGISGNVR